MLGSRENFGTLPDGSTVEKLTIGNGSVVCEILTYGAAIRSIMLPDKNGETVDVALGYDSLENYLAQDKFMGAVVGRYANRIGGARFTLNGTEYKLAVNDGVNHLHGGVRGFDKRVWDVKELRSDRATLSLHSPDGDENYPGNMDVEVTYAVSGSGLEITYEAVSDMDTVCNITNHAYYNLSGHASGEILDHSLQIFGEFYTPADSGSIPTGEIAPVSGTPMDFTTPHTIGERIGQNFEQLKFAGGYDHNWVIDGTPGEMRTAARVSSPDTGIVMTVETDQPGMQFYAGNSLDGSLAGKDGADYHKRCGLCLETQVFPDSPNHKNFPDAVLRAGERYHTSTRFSFSVM